MYLFLYGICISRDKDALSQVCVKLTLCPGEKYFQIIVFFIFCFYLLLLLGNDEELLCQDGRQRLSGSG